MSLRDESLIGLHPDLGVHVVTLGLTDQRVEDGKCVLPFADQGLQAVDECVLVSAVERVASLEGDRRIAAAFGQQLADFARREDVLAEFGVLRLRQHTNLTTDEV